MYSGGNGYVAGIQKIKNRGEKYDQFFNPLLGEIRRYKVFAVKGICAWEIRCKSEKLKKKYLLQRKQKVTVEYLLCGGLFAFWEDVSYNLSVQLFEGRLEVK